MSNVTREIIFDQAARKLRSDFEELSTIPHNALKGGEAEKLMKVFLKNHLPKRFAVGSGFIIDRLDNVSKQTDVIVYDAFNCPVYRASEDSAIFPSDNVAAVVEVKSRLDKDQLESAYQNIRATKRLAKTPIPDGIPYLIQEKTLGCLFAFESAISLDTITHHYHEILARENHIIDHIDIIVVLDKGIITMATKPQHGGWAMAIVTGLGGAEAEGSHIALGIQELGRTTLDAFLRFLLMHLSKFRGLMDHPGFNWQSSLPDEMMTLYYLCSITTEKDPEKKMALLVQYREDALKWLQANQGKKGVR